PTKPSGMTCWDGLAGLREPINPSVMIALPPLDGPLMFLASKKRHMAPWPQLKCQMRKFLITLAILAGCFAAVSAIWIFGGRQISLFIDRYRTIGTASQRINSISYEGSGTGGILHVNDLA